MMSLLRLPCVDKTIMGITPVERVPLCIMAYAHGVTQLNLAQGGSAATCTLVGIKLRVATLIFIRKAMHSIAVTARITFVLCECSTSNRGRCCIREFFVVRTQRFDAFLL